MGVAVILAALAGIVVGLVLRTDAQARETALLRAGLVKVAADIRVLEDIECARSRGAEVRRRA